MDMGDYEASGYVKPLSGLPLEYERDYGTARRNTEVPDIFDNPVIFSPRSIDSRLRTEELGYFILSDIRATGDDLPHSFLVREEAV